MAEAESTQPRPELALRTGDIVSADGLVFRAVRVLGVRGDDANPRAIAFQVYGLRDFTRRLVDLFGEFGDERFEGPAADLRELDPAADLQHGSERLAALLGDWHDASSRLAEQIGLRFFSHVGESSHQTFAT